MNKEVKLTYLIITINLIIGFVIIIELFAFAELIIVISSSLLHFFIGISALYISGYFIGKKMDFLINRKNWHFIYTGIIGLLSILLIGIFSGSTVGFLQEGIDDIQRGDDLVHALFNYYIRPLFWIKVFGIILAIASGGVLGILIKIIPQHPKK